jgi:hypothetical protein
VVIWNTITESWWACNYTGTARLVSISRNRSRPVTGLRPAPLSPPHVRLYCRGYSRCRKVRAILTETRKIALHAPPPPSSVYNNIPPERSILGSITGNRQFNCQLSPYECGRVTRLTESGIKPGDIQNLLNVLRGAVRSTLNLDYLHNAGQSQPRSGRPKSYSEATEQLIVRHVRLNLKDTFTELIQALDLVIKCTTIKSILT